MAQEGTFVLTCDQEARFLHYFVYCVFVHSMNRQKVVDDHG